MSLRWTIGMEPGRRCLRRERGLRLLVQSWSDVSKHMGEVEKQEATGWERKAHRGEGVEMDFWV